MITAVDSSVLWCLLNKEPGWRNWQRTLEDAGQEGDLVVASVVIAEISPKYPDAGSVLQDLEKRDVLHTAFTMETLFLAGEIHKKYRREGGPREHLIPDFLIAAHAQTQANRLAAIDRGFLRRYFPDLTLLRAAE